jgi:EAL domain-containing protein (putative c-di-GMP-specific phosphodiesterase class I)
MKTPTTGTRTPSIDARGTQLGLAAEIRDILRSTGLSPSRLDLEITETGIMENREEAVEKLAELKACGISISIDDFGPDYSVVAEGVETEARLRWLDGARCDHYRDFLFSPPLRARHRL